MDVHEVNLSTCGDHAGSPPVLAATTVLPCLTSYPSWDHFRPRIIQRIGPGGRVDAPWRDLANLDVLLPSNRRSSFNERLKRRISALVAE